MAAALCAAVIGVAAASEEASAPIYHLFVLNDAVPGMEDEFNRWYDEQHAQDVLINPGYLDSQRYVVSERQLRPGTQVPNKYAIKFRITTQDIARSLEYIHENIRSGKTLPTKSIARGSGTGGDFVYKATTSVMRGSAASAGGSSAPTKYIYIEFSTAAAGKQRQFDEWYDKVHAPKVAALTGARQWQRFELSSVQLTPRRISDVEPYMAMYDIEVSEPAALERLQQQMTELEKDGPADAGRIGTSYTYRAIGPLLSGEEVKKQRGVRSR